MIKSSPSLSSTENLKRSFKKSLKSLKNLKKNLQSSSSALMLLASQALASTRRLPARTCVYVYVSSFSLKLPRR